MINEFEGSKTSPEEIKQEQQQAISHLTDLMTLFYTGLNNGDMSPEIAAEKEKAMDIFTGKMFAKNIDLAKYKLYYVLMDMTIPEDVTDFDTPSLLGPLGTGEIEAFIEENFKRAK